MKTIVYDAYGMPEQLHLVETTKPTPADDEVLIRIFAASINSWDWDLLTGRPYLYRLLFGMIKPKFRTPGCDVAGRVEAAGNKVTRFKAGDEVFGDISGCHWGGFAEYVCAHEKAFTLKPLSWSFKKAAAIPQAAVLAWQSLTDYEPVQPGDKILINGAGGGVGTFALQMAKSMGAEVTCVDRNEKLDFLKSLGASRVMDYRQEDFSKSEYRYNRIIEVIATHPVKAYKRALLPNGRLIVIGGLIPTLLRIFAAGKLSKAEGKKLEILVHEPNKKIDNLVAFMESAKIEPAIDSTFSLTKVPEAFTHFGNGAFLGKIVITMD
jgi:NADPH:quinone reductase-like Zn-dependent oxidoreductase